MIVARRRRIIVGRQRPIVRRQLRAVDRQRRTVRRHPSAIRRRRQAIARRLSLACVPTIYSPPAIQIRRWRVQHEPSQAAPLPTLVELDWARDLFNKIEPRAFFYRSVTKLVAAVLGEDARSVNVDELVVALMMLLTTWNRNYYRFKNRMNLEDHFAELEAAIEKHLHRLIEFRRMRLDDVAELPEGEIEAIFRDFDDVLGRVGAAKCLHLLAPRFFPLWDQAILQRGYRMESGPYRKSSDAERYVAFMRITKNQLEQFDDLSGVGDDALKRLDEYNYVRFTKKLQPPI